jgi:hypothetical protein
MTAGKEMTMGRRMIRTSIILGSVLAISLHIAGCSRTESAPPGQSQKDQLVGLWERQWEFGPVIYQRELKADGSAVFREFRKPDSPDAKPPGTTAYHNYYKVALPLASEHKGTWSVHDGVVHYQVQLPQGQPLEMLYRVVKLGGSELVEAADGVGGATEAKYQRKI